MFKTIHKSVEKISENFLSQLRRHNYVTPTSYLELLTTFKNIMIAKKQEAKTQVSRLKSGLDKLQEANKSVAEMKIILKGTTTTNHAPNPSPTPLLDMQPKLEQSSIETEKMMAHLKIE